MATLTRNNAWNNNGTFDNTDLLWYAKGIQVMQSRPVSDPTSWWFYAAIHGQYLLNEITDPRYLYLNWKKIGYIPAAAQISKLPATKLTDLFWDQCQHATWFFLPWHRGYLAAFENVIRDIIINQLNGPADWALPYWNYLKEPAQYNIPPAFTMQQLPDGTANPLLVAERYGQSVDVGNGENEAHDMCQWDTVFTDGPNAAPNGAGNLSGYFYGGGETGFQHDNGSDTGDLEESPHNGVHGMIGSQNNRRQIGLMGVPNTAALDPVFYLHHANIDRMWAAWNVTGNNNNPTDANWLAGPSANGNSRFVMPLDNKGTAWYYTPEDMLSTTGLKYNGAVYAYTYDDLSLTSYNTTPPVQFPVSQLERVVNLGVAVPAIGIRMSNKRNKELVGASRGPITVTGLEANTSVRLDPDSWKTVSDSLLEATAENLPDEVFLELEGVKGGSDANFLSVYVNDKFVKSVSLFGLLGASMKDAAHGDGGLNFKFNITGIVDDMHLKGNIDVDSLNVQIKTKHALPDENAVTIDRIGVYRVGK